MVARLFYSEIKNKTVTSEKLTATCVKRLMIILKCVYEHRGDYRGTCL